MENIFEWAKNIEKGKRNKPTNELQKQLFNGILTNLKAATPSFDDCVGALMKFDKKVLEPFYSNYYPNFSDEQKQRWNEAVYNWACTVKPTEKVTIRLGPIMRVKLRLLTELSEISTELKWLSFNSDKKSNDVFVDIRTHSDDKDLIKLLSLDTSTYGFGKSQIEKMYSIIFSAKDNPEIQKLYVAFKVRNGFEEPKTAEIANPESVQDKSAEAEAKASSIEEIGVMNPAEKPIEGGKQENTTSDPAGKSLAQAELKCKTTAGSAVSADGLELAEGLLDWVRTHKQREKALEKELTDREITNKNLRDHIGQSTAEIKALRAELDEANAALAAQKTESDAAQERVLSLENEKDKANEMLIQIQQMSSNTIKQEINGFKHKLADELAPIAKDMASDLSDVSDAEKADVYKVLLEELMDTLKHNGVIIEEN